MHRLVIQFIFVFVVDATVAQCAVRPTVSMTRFGHFTSLLFTQETLAIARLTLQGVRVLLRLGPAVRTVLSFAIVGATALGAAGMFPRGVVICIGRLGSITTGSLAVPFTGTFSIGISHTVSFPFTVPTALAFGIPVALPISTTTFAVPATLPLLTVPGPHASTDPASEITPALV
jgi:hypothetical protein